MPSSQFKAGYVALIGRPNAGKSTLLNQLLEFKLSIVSPKAQTTRKKVLGFLTSENSQIIFIDTPGMIKPEYELQRKLMTYVNSAVTEANVVVLLIDAEKYLALEKSYDNELSVIKDIKIPVIALINKIDLVPKASLLTMMKSLSERYSFSEIIPVSALKKDGLDILIKVLVTYLPSHPPYYDADMLTEHPERFLVAEIIRECLFYQFSDEIPYACEVVVDEFKERGSAKDFVRAVIYVERDSQKGIVIGKQGATLKKLGEKARELIEKNLSRQVFLELHVKVNSGWRNDDSKLKQLGY